ncbi:hypothetical protein CMV30_05240 [Nibricoccus aquaticus]|uniref:Uncharacterized protein n=1 Tax=Nibricoccus aquaticus TaxID=2576891 RepID=A0A290Q4Q8_9BACT|nr:hypothetical protein [Nibricoccus aquaticus]ATC63403.1 hypothetical protein CMV30_05240 [Nibricoccus aquaticus]
MKIPIEGRWLGLAALIAIVCVAVLVLAVRFVSLPTPAANSKPVTPRTGGIGIASPSGTVASALLHEQSLLDPDPLFLPTQFNASQLRLPALIRREPGASFQPVSSKYTYTLAEAQISFPEPVASPAQPVDVLAYDRVKNPYEVLGRYESDALPLPERLAVVEIVQIKSGRVVFTAPLKMLDAPAQLASADWRPLELLAAVDATGLIGLPVLSRGSGVEAIDTFFLRSYLAKEFRLGERLPPGFYALRVGP